MFPPSSGWAGIQHQHRVDGELRAELAAAEPNHGGAGGPATAANQAQAGHQGKSLNRVTHSQPVSIA